MSPLLSLYDGLRVADIRDGMDVLGYHHYGSVAPAIRPLWRTAIIGIARTARYLPFRGKTPSNLSPDEYARWSGNYYGTICTYPWVSEIQPGEIMVIDQSGVDAGLVGSENSLAAMRRGLRGFVTNSSFRDTDELVLQKVPAWMAFTSQKMVQGRIQFDATQVPVAIGGVTVCPGDVVAADGDGVIVVPHDIAAEVAEHARAENKRDRIARRKHYEALGLKPDTTVE
jgi:regulator of RNase E activity RraA